jgi:hypothetical protein
MKVAFRAKTTTLMAIVRAARRVNGSKQEPVGVKNKPKQSPKPSNTGKARAEGSDAEQQVGGKTRKISPERHDKTARKISCERSYIIE